jgi:hypothetical protein
MVQLLKPSIISTADEFSLITKHSAHFIHCPNTGAKNYFKHFLIMTRNRADDMLCFLLCLPNP